MRSNDHHHKRTKVTSQDIRNRRGLKEVHDKFDTIHAKLDSIYALARRYGDRRKMACVVVLVAQMSVDTVLSSKFLAAGLMSKVTPLLGPDADTRNVVLQALLVIVDHGGLSAMEEVAVYNGVLARLVEDHPQDHHTVGLATGVMVAIVRLIFTHVEPPSSSMTERMSLPAVLRATVGVLRSPLPPRFPLPHALQLLACPTQHCPDVCRANPSLLPILVAITRSNRLSARIAAVNGLIGLHKTTSTQTPDITPLRLLDVLRSGRLCNYIDPEQSYTVSVVEDLWTYARLTAEAAKSTCDFYAVGVQLAQLVQRNDYAVTELFDDGAEDSAYLPGWLHALEACVHAVRTRGLASDFDSSEVLEMKLLALQGKSEEARALGKRAVARNPGLAYAYYIMARGASAEEGLRAAKDGLRCGGASQFTRSQLLWIAVEAAARTALTLQGSSVNLCSGVASLFSSALKDAQTFLDETPRDHPSIDCILTWKILLLILLRVEGHEEELKAQFKRIAGLIAELGYKTADRQLLDTQEYICQEYDRGLQEWEHLLEGLRNPDGEGEGTPVCGSAEADDFAWLEELVSGSGKRPEKLSQDQLPVCSWCRQPSAVLKRCGGCRDEV
ncbi:hypothetical protein LXA43DRAFT_902415 [Ganoderma leucocontextum]|nr:hypothetical protein LXA43DRAFT_902415 [Ganoderma leucocontextum]